MNLYRSAKRPEQQKEPTFNQQQQQQKNSFEMMRAR